MILSVGRSSRTLTTAELREQRLPEHVKSEHTDMAADTVKKAAERSLQPERLLGTPLSVG